MQRIWLSVGIAVVITAPFLAAADTAPVRQKLSCAEFQTTMKNMGHGATYTPGSWGSVPPELRELPPGAQHCGADAFAFKGGSALIVSPSFGNDLQRFYGPRFAKLGCSDLSCDIQKGRAGRREVQQTRCQCRGNRMLGTIATDTGAEAYEVTLVRY